MKNSFYPCPYCGVNMFHDRDLNSEGCPKCGFDSLYHSRDGSYNWRAGMARINAAEIQQKEEREEKINLILSEIKKLSGLPDDKGVEIRIPLPDRSTFIMLECFCGICGVSLDDALYKLFLGLKPIDASVEREHTMAIEEALRAMFYRFLSASPVEVRVTMPGKIVTEKVMAALKMAEKKDKEYATKYSFMTAGEILRHNILNWISGEKLM